MKRLITILFLFAGYASAQLPTGFTSVGNGAGRKIIGALDTAYAQNNAPGSFVYRSQWWNDRAYPRIQRLLDSMSAVRNTINTTYLKRTGNTFIGNDVFASLSTSAPVGVYLDSRNTAATSSAFSYVRALNNNATAQLSLGASSSTFSEPGPYIVGPSQTVLKSIGKMHVTSNYGILFSLPDTGSTGDPAVGDTLMSLTRGGGVRVSRTPTTANEVVRLTDLSAYTPGSMAGNQYYIPRVTSTSPYTLRNSHIIDNAGITIRDTLVFSANNQKLNAVVVSPSFTTGSYTGTVSTALRVLGRSIMGNALYTGTRYGPVTVVDSIDPGFIELQNKHNLGYTSINFNNNSGVRGLTVGLGNPGTPAPFPNLAYITTGEAAGPLAMLIGDIEKVRVTSTGVGFLSTVPTRTITLGSTATGISQFKTADQTTNYQEARMNYNGSIYEIGTYFGGSATAQSIKIGVTPTAGATDLLASRSIVINGAATVAAGFVDIAAMTSQNGSQFTMNTGFTASSGLQTMKSVQGTVAQSGTASAVAEAVFPYWQSTGSGTNYLSAWGNNSAAARAGTDSTKIAFKRNGRILMFSPTSLTNRIEFAVPSSITNHTLTWPGAVGANGAVLQTDASGNLSWVLPSTFGVTSITGTANQVIASASTGPVTLSLPQSIGTTSTPAFGGLTLTNTAAVPLSVRYDSSNRLDVSAGSSGIITYDAVGASASHSFSDPIIATSGFTSTAGGAISGGNLNLFNGAGSNYVGLSGTLVTANYTLRAPNKTAGSYTIATEDYVASNFWGTSGNQSGLSGNKTTTGYIQADALYATTVVSAVEVDASSLQMAINSSAPTLNANYSGFYPAPSSTGDFVHKMVWFQSSSNGGGSKTTFVSNQTSDHDITFQDKSQTVATTDDPGANATNATTVGLSSATLNSTYPNVPVGYRVICGNIILGGAVYVKYSEAGSSDVWLTISAPVTP